MRISDWSSDVCSSDLNGRVFTPGGLVDADIGVRGDKIAGIGVSGDAGEVIDCTGLTILPGAIDTQVHFREPGLEHRSEEGRLGEGWGRTVRSRLSPDY